MTRCGNSCLLTRDSSHDSESPTHFFKDIADGLVGVGLITQSEDCPGVLTLDKGYNDMSKFLNRILGIKVLFMIIILNYVYINDINYPCSRWSCKTSSSSTFRTRSPQSSVAPSGQANTTRSVILHMLSWFTVLNLVNKMCLVTD